MVISNVNPRDAINGPLGPITDVFFKDGTFISIEDNPNIKIVWAASSDGLARNAGVADSDVSKYSGIWIIYPTTTSYFPTSEVKTLIYNSVGYTSQPSVDLDTTMPEGM